jgi:hypothetical protein
LRLPKGTSALPIERDAWAFLKAAGITSALQQRAVVQLVRDLKKAQLWTKMKAIYPFVGGTATSHKWNLKDPQDTDAAFRLTFSGGWTHSSNGADPNGTNAYANTQMQTDTLGLNSAHLSYYSRENVASSMFDIGASDAASVASGCIPNWGSGLGCLSRIGQAFSTIYTPTTTAHYHLVSANSTNTSRVYENGVYKGQNTGARTSLGVRYYYIGAVNQSSPNQNNGVGNFYSSRQCAFATIGDGLTDAEASLLYQCVDRYQKTLGRAV